MQCMQHGLRCTNAVCMCTCCVKSCLRASFSFFFSLLSSLPYFTSLVQLHTTNKKRLRYPLGKTHQQKKKNQKKRLLICRLKRRNGPFVFPRLENPFFFFFFFFSLWLLLPFPCRRRAWQKRIFFFLNLSRSVFFLFFLFFLFSRALFLLRGWRPKRVCSVVVFFSLFFFCFSPEMKNAKRERKQ